MKCEKCGKEISNLLVIVFNFDGSDSEYKYPISECEESAVFFDADTDWTGYALPEEKQKDTILCPHCKQFPFKKDEIQVENIVRAICFKEHMNKRAESKPLLALEPYPFVELSWFSFIEMLRYKAKWYGRTFIQVSPFYPSFQLCNKCRNLLLKDKKPRLEDGEDVIFYHFPLFVKFCC